MWPICVVKFFAMFQKKNLFLQVMCCDAQDLQGYLSRKKQLPPRPTGARKQFRLRVVH